MASTNRFTAAVSIAILLLGNFAGWLHVGCHLHSHAQCSHHSVNQGELGNGCEPGQSKPACCQHSVRCGDDAEAVSSAKVASSADRQVPAEHPADNCEVCKNFLSLRTAVIVVDVCAATSAVELADVQRIASQRVEDFQHRGVPPLRGPPTV